MEQISDNTAASVVPITEPTDKTSEIPLASKLSSPVVITGEGEHRGRRYPAREHYPPQRLLDYT